jgi:hypothetical protein
LFAQAGFGERWGGDAMLDAPDELLSDPAMMDDPLSTIAGADTCLFVGGDCAQFSTAVFDNREYETLFVASAVVSDPLAEGVHHVHVQPAHSASSLATAALGGLDNDEDWPAIDGLGDAPPLSLS